MLVTLGSCEQQSSTGLRVSQPPLSVTQVTLATTGIIPWLLLDTTLLLPWRNASISLLLLPLPTAGSIFWHCSPDVAGTDTEATLSAEYGGTGSNTSPVDAVYIALGRVLTISGRTIRDEAQVSQQHCSGAEG